MKRLLAVLVGIIVASGAMADSIVAGGDAVASKPLQLSLTPSIAIHDRSETIEGLTLGIWSENPQAALALGIVNGLAHVLAPNDQIAHVLLQTVRAGHVPTAPALLQRRAVID